MLSTSIERHKRWWLCTQLFRVCRACTMDWAQGRMGWERPIATLSPRMTPSRRDALQPFAFNLEHELRMSDSVGAYWMRRTLNGNLSRKCPMTWIHSTGRVEKSIFLNNGISNDDWIMWIFIDLTFIDGISDKNGKWQNRVYCLVRYAWLSIYSHHGFGQCAVLKEISWKIPQFLIASRESIKTWTNSFNHREML